MTTTDLIEQIELQPLSQFQPREVKGVFVSDMVSDFLASAKSGNLWLTVQTHKSLVPAANLMDVSGVVITNGKQVPQDTLDLATKYDIPILSTQLNTFALVGKLYELGLRAE